MQEKSSQDRWLEMIAGCVIIALGFWFLFNFVFAHSTSRRITGANVLMQQARQLGLMMFAYSTDNTDHGNAYPDGGSSTEVFQKMLDGGYASDPMIFYIPMAGKVPPVAGHKLRPENVCFDITGGVLPSDSDLLPLVFSTGYRMSYTPGGEATPVLMPRPQYLLYTRQEFLFFPPHRVPIDPGVAVFYKGNNVIWLKALGGTVPYAVPRVVSSSWPAGSKTYRQLTPDGVLPPK